MSSNAVNLKVETNYGTISKDGHVHNEPKLREQRRNLLFKSASTISTDILSLIIFWTFTHNADSDTCTGEVYRFGQVAIWGSVILCILDIVELYTGFSINKKRQKELEQGISRLRTIIIVYYFCLGFMWLYAVYALTDKEHCEREPLYSFIWIWIFLTIILPVSWYLYSKQLSAELTAGDSISPDSTLSPNKAPTVSHPVNR